MKILGEREKEKAIEQQCTKKHFTMRGKETERDEREKEGMKTNCEANHGKANKRIRIAELATLFNFLLSPLLLYSHNIFPSPPPLFPHSVFYFHYLIPDTFPPYTLLFFPVTQTLLPQTNNSPLKLFCFGSANSKVYTNESE